MSRSKSQASQASHPPLPSPHIPTPAELAKIDNITRWSQSGKKAILSASLSRSAAAAQEELVHLNHELKTRRRAKLREFYEECEEKVRRGSRGAMSGDAEAASLREYIDTSLPPT